MRMNTKAVIIGVIAVVLVIAVVAFTFSDSDDDDSDDSITIVDGAGQTIRLDAPLTNVCTINNNIPKAMIMLGIQDYITCYHWSASNHFGLKAESVSGADLGTYYTPSVEALLDFGVQAVLCPVASMTLYASTEKACEQNGIPVIRLDCNGDSLFDDLNKLSEIFGNPASATEKLSTYSTDYSSVVDATRNALKSTDKVDYIYAVINSGSETGAMYNVNSAIADLVEGVYGRNITSYTDLSTTGVTNTINDGSIEAVSKVMDHVGVFVMRSVKLTKDVADLDMTNFVGTTNKLVTPDSPAYQNDRILVLNSNLVSGLYGHIGLLLAAQLTYGISVDGYSDVSKVISEFQERYNQSLIADGDVIAVQYGAGMPDGTVYTYTA